MECERLNRLVRSWYVQVQEEALAPARMVEFMEKHVKTCEVCLADPDVRSEVKKITQIVLPPSKVIKTAKDNADDTKADDESSPPDSSEEESDDVSDAEDEDEDDEEEDEEDGDGDDDDDDFIPSSEYDEDDDE